jgi:hypothetical protein
MVIGAQSVKTRSASLVVRITDAKRFRCLNMNYVFGWPLCASLMTMGLILDMWGRIRREMVLGAQSAETRSAPLVIRIAHTKRFRCLNMNYMFGWPLCTSLRTMGLVLDMSGRIRREMVLGAQSAKTRSAPLVTFIAHTKRFRCLNMNYVFGWALCAILRTMGLVLDMWGRIRREMMLGAQSAKTRSAPLLIRITDAKRFRCLNISYVFGWPLCASVRTMGLVLDV